MKTNLLTKTLFLICSLWSIVAFSSVEKKRTIKAIADTNYAPFSFLNEEGELVGYSIDAAKAIFDAAGLDYEFQYDNWNNTLDKFEKDSLDAIVGMAYSESRTSKYAFNFSIAHIHFDFILSANSSITKQEELKGKRIISFQNYVSDEYLRRINFTDSLIIAASPLEGLKLLKKGKADAMICNRTTAAYYIKKNFKSIDFTSISSDLPPFEHAIVTHLYDIDLLYKLDKAFFIVKEKGTLDALYHKWFGEYDYITRYKLLIYILIGIGVLLFITVLFVLILRHKVKIATVKLTASRSSLLKINKQLDKKVSELEEKDRKLQRAKEKAEHSDRLKSLFLANMSHEIRTPLNAIVGFSELVTDEEDKEIKKHYSHLITANSNLLLSIINDILDLSKIESGIIDFEPQQFDFAENFRFLEHTLRQEIKNPAVKFIVKNPYKNCLIEGDKNRLSQIITNFVTNAQKFTPKGTIEMGYTYKDKGLYVYVKDTGIGIKEKYLKKIFDRFYKVNEFSQGTGLGMSICKAIMESCHGEIGVESTYKEGSTFWFFYPCEVEIITP